MNKKEFKKRPYVRSMAEVIKVDADAQIMAASPNVQPGVSIEDPKEDDDDTEISGAKQFNMWEGWDD
ncbi:hypothetical protein J4866_04590 [Prevotella denticola]|uniref:hypothetical protein n=1 Tax=Prevotellaceae TaxID=171552 RepID=UPI000510596E|nr:hypothetical protein [Prevotella denticola]KGF38827.1 hypothetical protein HMPREF2139_11455 [Prevotella denticola DNF00960]QUB92255.1 hypothetical protein J4866_04590 [Prevotella denticola]